MTKITVLHNELDKFVEDFSGFSLLIEVDNKKILFDTSFADEILNNAKQAGIDLTDLDFIILSHGHWDHTNGLEYLQNIDALVIAHPDCFAKRYEGKKAIGSSLNLAEVNNNFKTLLSRQPYQVTKNAVFLGEIPRTTSFENKNPCGKRMDGSDDFVLDDSALVINSNDGLIIISGCSHAGICNIIEYTKKIMHENKILAVIGGLHLFDNEQTDCTIEYLKMQSINKIYPAHCLNDYAFTEFSKIGAERIDTLQQLNF